MLDSLVSPFLCRCCSEGQGRDTYVPQRWLCSRSEQDELWLRGTCLRISSVQFSCSVVSDSLGPCGPQHARLPCPSPTPGTCSNSCPSSQWCHPTISSSVAPFSCCLQSSPALGSLLMNQFFTSGGQNIGVSASASVLPMNIQDWFPVYRVILNVWVSL